MTWLVIGFIVVCSAGLVALVRGAARLLRHGEPSPDRAMWGTPMGSPLGPVARRTMARVIVALAAQVAFLAGAAICAVLALGNAEHPSYALLGGALALLVCSAVAFGVLLRVVRFGRPLRVVPPPVRFAAEAEAAADRLSQGAEV